ncbi:VOC family protein [Streptomyces sp. NPDC053720]|uniref:VOC family protein n=1 Tax=Streptomyces sp. NPDC053720 TaxID=3154855 RepID=UPI0034461C34
MTLEWKVVIDSTDPHAQATFWGEALGYTVEDHSVLIERLLGFGAVPEDVTLVAHDRRAWRDLAGVRHPDDPYDKDSGAGLGRRLLFQRVPEAKTTKNRLHLDVHAGPERRQAEVERLVGLGAAVLREVAEQGGTWTVLTDPEGNEFCVQ